MREREPISLSAGVGATASVSAFHRIHGARGTWACAGAGDGEGSETCRTPVFRGLTACGLRDTEQ